MPTTLWSATFAGEPPRYDVDIDRFRDVDIVVIGAGYTGLWTALSVLRADPSRQVLVLERHRVGFGASGRNGGWCSALLPIGLPALARRHGRDRAVLLQRAMFDTVTEIERFADSVGWDTIGFARGGTITLAHDRYQRARIDAAVAEMRRFGFDEGDLRVLAAAEARSWCTADRVVGAMYTPHCAALHPLRFAHAIASAATRAGATIAEGVSVTDVQPHRIETNRGTIRARVVVLASEAYTTTMPGRKRDVLPLYSMMIGSEPLSAAQWAEIGLDRRPTFTSASNMVIYGQRTADGRLAFGGRGAPYHYGSGISARFDTDERVRSMLVESVRRLFPALRDTAFPFHWGGPLGIARDWHPHVRFDRSTGLASAGGYAGDGVATANLTGRALGDLITDRDSDLVGLPIVGHRSRRWEPEPLRWLGVRAGALAAARADRAEASARPLSRLRASAWSSALHVLSGR